jgi:hypothetical protein
MIFTSRHWVSDSGTRDEELVLPRAVGMSSLGRMENFPEINSLFE